MWLTRLIDWFFSLFRRRPGRLKHFTAEADMANVRLAWELPAASNRQHPIAHVRIEARVSEDLGWTLVAEVPAAETQLLLEDQAPGDWFYRGYVVDDQGTVGKGATATALVAFDPPGELASFTATVE